MFEKHMNKIAYLHNHTDHGSNLRMLDCINKVPALIDRAVELQAYGLAITDHESLSAHVQALKYVKEGKEKGTIPEDFKLILGNEIYLVNSLEEVRNNYIPKETQFWHFIILAKDLVGHKQLRELSSLAWKNSFYTGKMERTPTVKADLVKIVKANPGHLIASTACLGGELPYWILRNNWDKVNEFLGFCYDLFGTDFFLEIQPSNSPDQIEVNKTIIKICDSCNFPYIVTTDSHYLKKEDRSIHEAYLNSREDEERELADFYATTYLQNYEEIHGFLDEQIGAGYTETALNTTCVVADEIQEFDLYHKQIVPKVRIPNFTMQHSFANAYEKYEYIKKFAYSEEKADQYLLYLIEQGWWEKQYNDSLTADQIEIMISRINDELEAIWESSIKIEDNVASYYLSALEIINMMWDDSDDGGNSLVGPSRGSVASFYTSYLIGIQQLNPLKWNIPYWRHLHPSRPEMPDIDIDSEKSKRQRIIYATGKKFGFDHVLNICTFKTEGSKSSILTAARGLGIDSSIAQYIANMIPVVRGKTTSLTVMVNGDDENGIRPNTEFINECRSYPRLLDVAMSIEGMVCGRSIHASGVIIFDDPYTEHNCMMRSPNGQTTTQWSMEDSEYCGGLKYDYLTVEAMDSMRICFDFLVKYGYVEWQGNLRSTYNKYFHPDVLDYDSEDMWKMAENLEIVNLFQFQTQVGSKAIQAIKPRNLRELGTANAVMRLMVSKEPDETEDPEQPIDTYVRYKNDIGQWYSCMKNKYQLTQPEISILEKYLLPVHGMASMQEEVMELVMDDHISDFTMQEANKLRKSIAKKKVKLQLQAKDLFYKHGHDVKTRINLLDYVWKEVIKKQLGYSFSLPHVAGYSTIAVQEMNMAYHYPIIYWNTANLIVNSGSMDMEDSTQSTNYGKIATAISNMQKRGENITLPLINSMDFGFIPDEEHDRIIYSVKAINGIGDEVAREIIKNRPYSSFEDFCKRMISTGKVKTSQMVQLIKAGCFTELHAEDRRETMKEFLQNYVITPVSKLTLAQFDRLVAFNEQYGFIPDSVKESILHKFFKDYVLDDCFFFKNYVDPAKARIPKAGYRDRWFKLDNVSMRFFQNHYTENSVELVDEESYVISEKKFIKENNIKLEPLRDWLATGEAVNQYNLCLLREAWKKYGAGTVSKWEMDSLSIYCTQEHELAHVKGEQYGIVDFFSLPATAEVYDTFTRTFRQGDAYVKKEFPKYKITRIAGTILDKNKDRHIVTILTTTGVVNVKFDKGQFAHYDRQLSESNGKGGKTVLEKSWFTRGNKVVICGFRREDQFVAKKYTETVWKHTCGLITDVTEDGQLTVQLERGDA